MNQAETVRTLRAIKGHPCTILLFLYISRRTVTQAEISNALGYDTKTTRHHLRALLSMGLVEHPQPHAWHLPAGQLHLPGFPTILPPDTSYPQLPPGSQSKQGDSPGFTPTTTTTLHDNKEVRKVVGADPNREILPVSAELAAELRTAGIGTNAWPTLAGLEHITPAYVHAMRTKIMNHPEPAKRTAAFLIHCMRSGDPVPQICDQCNGIDDNHTIDCPDRRRRYQGGRYAHLVET